MKTPVIVLLFSLLSCYGNLFAAPPAGKEMCIVVLGDSLTAGIVLTLLLGLLGTWKALGQKPASYLRQE
ncbi:MAG: hypothetical protein KAT62_08585 [Desulfuromonadales bacterium]|nr:hypothetical protein [Desulfuromonadales bacterium]